MFTTDVVSSNPADSNNVLMANVEVYSMRHYVIKVGSDFRQICVFRRVLRLPQTIKLTATI